MSQIFGNFRSETVVKYRITRYSNATNNIIICERQASKQNDQLKLINLCLRQKHSSQCTLIRTHWHYHDTITIGANRHSYECSRKLFHSTIPT